MGDRYLCTLSGGFDSAAALQWALECGPTEALFIQYGQRGERQERRAVTFLATLCPAICQHPNFLGLRSISSELLLDRPGSQWVPYRSLSIAAIAANVAALTGASHIVFGVRNAEYQMEDPISFMDATVRFYQALELLIYRFTEPHHRPSPTFVLPLVGWNKRAVLSGLHISGVELKKLWNCLREDEVPEPCGECENCATTQPLVDFMMRD